MRGPRQSRIVARLPDGEAKAELKTHTNLTLDFYTTSHRLTKVLANGKTKTGAGWARLVLTPTATS